MAKGERIFLLMTIKAFLIESNTGDKMLPPKRYFQTEFLIPPLKMEKGPEEKLVRRKKKKLLSHKKKYK